MISFQIEIFFIQMFTVSAYKELIFIEHDCIKEQI